MPKHLLDWLDHHGYRWPTPDEVASMVRVERLYSSCDRGVLLVLEPDGQCVILPEGDEDLAGYVYLASAPACPLHKHSEDKVVAGILLDRLADSVVETYLVG